MVRELNFFLGIQIKTTTGIFINQGKYVKQLLKKYKLDDVMHVNTPMHRIQSCTSIQMVSQCKKSSTEE